MKESPADNKANCDDHRKDKIWFTTLKVHGFLFSSNLFLCSQKFIVSITKISKIESYTGLTKGLKQECTNFIVFSAPFQISLTSFDNRKNRTSLIGQVFSSLIWFPFGTSSKTMKPANNRSPTPSNHKRTCYLRILTCFSFFSWGIPIMFRMFHGAPGTLMWMQFSSLSISIFGWVPKSFL